MSNDPYSLCICGSGKKLKFCCQDILQDMQRIKRLLDNQPDVAEKMLEQLYTTHPDKEVLVTELAELKQEQGQQDEARELCIEYLRRHSDESRVLLCLASLSLERDGFESARRIIHRALQLVGPEHWARVSVLLGKISSEMNRRQNSASAFAHAVLAARYAPPELRRRIAMTLEALHAQAHVYWPFFGPFQLLPTALNREAAEVDERARRLSALGCWEPSAILYSRIAQAHPENGSVWYNLGLFQLWDGRPAESMESLRRAAEFLQDFDTSVEAETLASLLTLDHFPGRAAVMERSCQVTFPQRLQELLDSDPRFLRASLDRDSSPDNPAVHTFRLLVDAPALPDGGLLYRAEIGVVLFDDGDVKDDDNGVIDVVASGAELDDVWQILREIGGDDIAENGFNERTLPAQRTGCSCFDRLVHYEKTVGIEAVRQRDRTCFENSLKEWMESPQPQLGNRSPAQLAADPEQRRQTAAAFLTLQALCHRMERHDALDDVRQSLNVAEPAKIRPSPDQSMNTIPLLQLARLALSELTDDQVLQSVNLATGMQDIRLLEQSLDELMNRPTALAGFTPRRAHLLRASIARLKGRKEDLDEAFEAARVNADSDADAFRERLELDLKELNYRLDDPDDPRIPQLLRELSEQYFVKVPEVAKMVKEELTRSGCEHLLTQVETLVEVVAGSEPEEKPASKLWLPGQD